MRPDWPSPCPGATSAPGWSRCSWSPRNRMPGCWPPSRRRRPGWTAGAVGRRPDPPVEIPVDYAGADLDEVARMLGCGVDAVVAAHQAQSWSVAMMGFAPGFGYLVPEGPWLLDWSSVSRRDRPRDRVPAGSVALAAGMSAVYPEEMPGGWQLLGHTPPRLFDAATRPRPACCARPTPCASSEAVGEPRRVGACPRARDRPGRRSALASPESACRCPAPSTACAISSRRPC